MSPMSEASGGCGRRVRFRDATEIACGWCPVEGEGVQARPAHSSSGPVSLCSSRLVAAWHILPGMPALWNGTLPPGRLLCYAAEHCITFFMTCEEVGMAMPL